MYTLNEVKTAIVETVKENPKEVKLLVGFVSIGLIALSCKVDIFRLNRKITKVSDFVFANAVNEEQHFCNVLGRIDFIADSLQLSKEGIEAAGSAAAKANWQRLGFNDEIESKLLKALDGGLK